METCANCSEKFDRIMIDVPILERDPETRDDFFTRRPDSDLCHACLFRSVAEKKNKKSRRKTNRP